MHRDQSHFNDEFDAQIAAVTPAHGAAIATRNAKNFEDCGIDIINPWAWLIRSVSEAP